MEIRPRKLSQMLSLQKSKNPQILVYQNAHCCSIKPTPLLPSSPLSHHNLFSTTLLSFPPLNTHIRHLSLYDPLLTPHIHIITPHALSLSHATFPSPIALNSDSLFKTSCMPSDLTMLNIHNMNKF